MLAPMVGCCDSSAGAAAASGVAAGRSFHALLGELAAEHARLCGALDAIAAENRALRQIAPAQETPGQAHLPPLPGGSCWATLYTQQKLKSKTVLDKVVCDSLVSAVADLSLIADTEEETQKPYVKLPEVPSTHSVEDVLVFPRLRTSSGASNGGGFVGLGRLSGVGEMFSGELQGMRGLSCDIPEQHAEGRFRASAGGWQPVGSVPCRVRSGVSGAAPTRKSSGDVICQEPVDVTDLKAEDGLGTLQNYDASIVQSAAYRVQLCFGIVGIHGSVTMQNVTDLLSKCRCQTEQMEQGLQKLFDLVGVMGSEGALRPGRSSPLMRLGNKSFDHTKSLDQSIPFLKFVEIMLVKSLDDIVVGCDDQVLETVNVVRKWVLLDDPRELVASAVGLDDLDLDYEDVGKPTFDRYIDIVMAVVILANAACIGIFADMETPEGQTWTLPQIVDTIFLIIFVAEMLIKMQRAGVAKHFRGSDWQWNVFDGFIVILGVVDFIMSQFVLSDQGGFNPSSLMAMRMVRLVRVVRLARVLRIHLFRELKLMLNGIMGLLRTLFCAIILIFLIIYFLGIVLSQLFAVAGGDELVVGQGMLFGDVPRSMFTVFRCLMEGDCSTINGTPIPLHLSNTAGWPFVLFFCTCSVLMNYGIGSLITALVVDSTLNAAKQTEFRNAVKSEQKRRMAAKIGQLSLLFVQGQQRRTKEVGGSDHMLFMSRESFMEVCQDPQVMVLFDEIDIDESDRADLFDSLDADGNGHLELQEFVEGLVKMRGKARKADVVGSRLMLGALMSKLTRLEAELLDNQRQQLFSMDQMTDLFSSVFERRTTPLAKSEIQTGACLGNGDHP